MRAIPVISPEAAHNQGHTMIEFRIDDMTCGHCEASVRKAVASIAPTAHTQVSVAEHRVSIDAPDASAAALEQAIRGAGFTPKPLTAAG